MAQMEDARMIVQLIVHEDIPLMDHMAYRVVVSRVYQIISTMFKVQSFLVLFKVPYLRPSTSVFLMLSVMITTKNMNSDCIQLVAQQLM